MRGAKRQKIDSKRKRKKDIERKRMEEREREGDRTRSHFMLANLFSFNRDIA